MKKNMSQKDKLIRVLIAFGIALLFYFQIIKGIVGIALMLFAIALLLTCLFRFSPLYKIIGVNTNKNGSN